MQYGNVIAHLDAQLRLSDQRHELVVQQRRAMETEAAKAALGAQLKQARAEYAKGILDNLAEAEQKAAQLAEDMVKAEKKQQDRILRAPIDGTVQQLALHTIGGVVTPAQMLMVVVPVDSSIEAEVVIQNKDIGFVHDGDPAEIKVDTFNFTKYGLVHGKVLGVSHDAILRDRLAAAVGPDRQTGSTTRGGEPSSQELLYAARVTLDRTAMEVDGKPVNLASGMAVTVEIKTGSRRIIEFLLSPILRYRQESLRER
jgi:hemolysin D